GRVDVAARRQTVDVPAIRADGIAESVPVRGRQAVLFSDLLRSERASHAERLEDVRFDVSRPRRTGDLLDEPAEDDRVEVGVLERLSHRPVQLEITHAGDDLGEGLVPGV